MEADDGSLTVEVFLFSWAFGIIFVKIKNYSTETGQLQIEYILQYYNVVVNL